MSCAAWRTARRTARVARGEEGGRRRGLSAPHVEAAEELVHAPSLGELDAGARELSLALWGMGWRG